MVNPYEPVEIERNPTVDVNPLFAIPVAFGGFTLVVVGFVWIVDHIFRWQYELPFRWWM